MAPPIEENASGTVDGINDTFDTSAAYRPTTLKAFLNGIFNLPVVETGGTSFTVTPPPQAGDTIAVYYFTT